jgi:hypothetical protein
MTTEENHPMTEPEHADEHADTVDPDDYADPGEFPDAEQEQQ